MAYYKSVLNYKIYEVTFINGNLYLLYQLNFSSSHSTFIIHHPKQVVDTVEI